MFNISMPVPKLHKLISNYTAGKGYTLEGNKRWATSLSSAEFCSVDSASYFSRFLPTSDWCEGTVVWQDKSFSGETRSIVNVSSVKVLLEVDDLNCIIIFLSQIGPTERLDRRL